MRDEMSQKKIFLKKSGKKKWHIITIKHLPGMKVQFIDMSE